MKRAALALLLTTRLALGVPEETAQYQEASSAYQMQKYALARTLTEKMLRANPDDYAALLVMGQVYQYGEGSIPRAYYCYSRSRGLLENAYREPAKGPSSSLYFEVLSELADTAEQLEHYQEALDLHDLRAELYPGTRTAASKGWPMMKLGRFEEARRLLQKVVDDPDYSGQRGVILNTLATVELESDHLEKSYDYFQQLIQDSESQNALDPVDYSNTGEVARDLMRYDECEKLLLKSTEHFHPLTYCNPWGMLAELYASQNRLPEALEALKKMQAWRLSCSAQISQHKWATCYGHVGSVLLQMGHDKKALEVLTRLVRRQDRNATTSSQPTLAEARLVFLYAQALQRETQRLRERLSYCSWRETPANLARLWQSEGEFSRAHQRVGNLITCKTGIDGFIQPYGALSLDQPALAPACWASFGPAATIAAARRSLARPDFPERRAYLSAILGEACLNDWDSAGARQHLAAAIDGLPQSEVKLRNRCRALVVKALLQEGKLPAALPDLQILMDSDPSALRACQVRLPLTIESDGGRGASQARQWLFRSPRCAQAGGAFRLKIEGGAGGLKGELFSPDGTQVGTFHGQPRGDETEAARNFCEIFHAQAFAPVIDLSQGDIRSIDGSNSVTRTSVVDELEK